MKTGLLVLAVLAVLVGAGAGVYFYNSFREAPNQVASTCRDPVSTSSHVYHAYRLQIVKRCITATGTVDRVIEEEDGDLHIRLHLDQAYSNLTNSANDQYQYGDLVAEIICVNPPTQQDAIPACQNYTNQIPIPSVCQHITVTGPYVLDTEHYNWAEIHPVYSLVIGPSLKAVCVTGENLNISYPGGATNGWLGPSPRLRPISVTVNSGEQFTDTLSLYSTSASLEQITSITVSTPGFSMVSVSPNPPITFSAGATVDISFTIRAPDYNYIGPIDIQIVTA